MGNNILGKRLKILRSEIGLTQEELGEIINVSKPTISRYESGSNEPNSDILKKLANYFNISMDYLMGTSNIREPAEKIIKKHQYELSIPEFYKSKYKIAKKDKEYKEHYEDLIENANTFFMDDNVAEEDLETIYKDISELFWEAKEMKKKK